MAGNFILSYNAAGIFPSEGQLLNHVRINRLIIGYYQPFAGTYILKSNNSAHDLNESFKGFFEAWPYILIQFDNSLAAGSLPQTIWDWINFGTIPLPPPPPPPQNVLQALLEAGKRS